MKKQNFDHQIRERLGDYRSELDTEALWKDLAPQLAADKKRRRGIFWWWSGAGVCLILAVWGWFATQNPQQLSAEQEKASEQQVAQSREVAALEAASTPSHLEETSNVQSTSEVATGVQETASINPLPASGGAMQKQSISRLPKSKAALTGSRNLPNVSLPENKARLSRLSPSEKVTVRDNPGLTSAGNVAIKATAPSEQEQEGAQQLGMETQSKPQTGAENGNTALSTLTFLEIKSLMLQRELPAKAATKQSKTPKPEKRRDFLIRPNFEIGYAFKTLNDRISPDSADYHLLARRESEEALEYLHGSLLLGMRHPSGWYALTGLGYTRITERFSYNATSIERDSVGGITEIYINAEGESILTEGLIERTRHIHYLKRTYSSYTLLDVPVIAGYDREKGRWSFGAEAGVFINISLKAKGDALDRNGDFIRVEDSDWFKPSIGLSYYGSLRVGYALDKKTRISLGPTFRYVPDISNRDNSDYVQRYGLFGLNLGLARQF